MAIEVRDALLRRSVDHLGSFAREAFKIGISLSTAESDGCVCTLRPEGRDGGKACRAFGESLFTSSSPLNHCPGGLSVVARPVEISPTERLLLASHGFLEEGQHAPAGSAAGAGRRRTPGEIPRLNGVQIRLLEDYLGMGADLVHALARTTGEVALEEFREETWRDLLGSPTIVGASPAIAAMREALPTVANSREPLFLAGEPGSGRALVAATVHRLGPAGHRPFIAENLAALEEALQETELFGGERAPGLLRQAAGGTLYLADAERLTAGAQERLAAFLSEERPGHATKRGAPRPEVRVISSAGAELESAVRRGRFRKDLADRLCALTLEVPALRERLEDVPLLVEHLLHRHAVRLGTPPAAIAPDALEALKKHSWAGNVRELEEELERAAAGRTMIRLEDLSAPLARSARGPQTDSTSDLRTVVGEVEVGLIERTLAETGWNKSRAARLLGLSRLGLQKKIDRYGIDRRR